MNSDKYGIEHFKHNLNFSSCTLYSDKNPNPNLVEKGYDKLDWLFVRYVENDGVKYINLNEQIPAEYALHFIGDSGPSGTLNNVSIDFTQTQLDILEDYLIDLTQDSIDYYTVDNKNYIRLDGTYDLDEVELVAEAVKGAKKVQPPIPHPIFSTIFISDDGAKLISASRAITKVHPKEVVFFIEVGEQNYFGSVIRVKVGSEVTKVSSNLFNFVTEITKSFGSELTASLISEIVNETIDDRDSVFTLISKGLEYAGELVKWPVDFVFDGIDDIMTSIISSINELKLDKNKWEAFVDGKKNEEYDPVLPGYKFFSDEKNVDKFFKKIQKNYISPLKDEYLTLIETLQEYPPFDQLLSLKLDEFGLIIFQRVEEVLKLVLTSIQEIGALAFEYLNGIIVGLINSLIGVIEGIVFIIKLIFNLVHAIISKNISQASNPTEYISWLIEVLENVIGITIDLFTVKNFKAIFQFLKEALYKGAKGIGMLLEPDPNTGLLRKIPADDIGYAVGFIVGLVIEEALYVLATGGAGNVIDAISVVFRETGELVAKSGRLIKTGIKLTGETLLKALQAAKEFIKDLPNQLKAILAKIDEFMTPVNNFLGYTVMLATDLLELVKRFVTLEDINRFNDLGLAYARTSDGRYVEVYNDIDNGKQHLIDFFADVNKLGDNLKNKAQKSSEKIKKEIKTKIGDFDEIYKTLYKRPKNLYLKLTRKEVLQQFGKEAAELFDIVEKEWEAIRNVAKSGRELGKKVLVSGMVDKKTGKVSKLFNNFTPEEVKNKKHLEFIKNLHPTLDKRIKEHLKRRGKNGKGLNLEDPDVIVYAWKEVNIAHAEFRALDDILKHIDPKGELGESVFNRIIGYNSYLRKSGIQGTCADCFYLTHGVTFIKTKKWIN